MSVSNGPRRGLMINALTGDNFDTDFRKLLRAIDALLAAAVINLTTSAPPGSPTNGDAYIVKASGSGVWSGHDNALAIWTTDNPSAPSGHWEFYAAAKGMIVVNAADGFLYVWTAPRGPLLAREAGEADRTMRTMRRRRPGRRTTNTSSLTLRTRPRRFRFSSRTQLSGRRTG
jgi:Protein of unknown function (DUF2793)